MQEALFAGATEFKAHRQDERCGAYMYKALRSSLQSTNVRILNIGKPARCFLDNADYVSIESDIFKSPSFLTTPFDIIIINVEPRGREVELYELYAPLMKPSHLCILKGLAAVDLFGALFADRFIDKYYETTVNDYFADYKLRDVFVLMDKEGGRSNRSQKLAGGVKRRYTCGRPVYCTEWE